MNRQEKLQDALEWVETLQENYGGQEETQDLAEALGVAAETIKAAQADTLTKIRAEILDEAEYAYADFDKYKEDILHAEPDELPDDDFRYGMERAVEIIDKYRRIRHE